MTHNSLRLTVTTLAAAAVVAAGIGTATADIASAPADGTAVAGGLSTGSLDTMSSAAATGSGMYIWGPIENAIFGVICAIVPGSAGSFICPAPGVK